MVVSIQTILQSSLPAGPSGHSGISGYSGYSGISGYSGASGISGYSGRSGYSGYSGAAGISGFSGYSGTAGISGFSGYSGTTGISGFSGYSGISGYSGRSGFSGYSGPSGYSGYSGIGVSGYSGMAGGGLLPTSVKTSLYTVAIGEMVRCNTTAGGFVVTLPTSPVDGGEVGIQDSYNQCGINPVTVNRGGTNTIEGDTSILLDVTGGVLVLSYVAATGNWKVFETPGQTGLSGYSGVSGYSGADAGIINATQDVVTAALYPVMVGATGSNQTAKASSGKFWFNAATGSLTGGDTGSSVFTWGVGSIGTGVNKISVDGGSGSGGGSFFEIKANGVRIGLLANEGAVASTTSADFMLFAESGKSIKFATNGSATPKLTIDTAGNLKINGNSNGIYGGSSAGYYYFSGGTTNVLGGAIFCFAESHVTNANEIQLRNSSNATRLTLDASGHMLPGANGTQNLGSAALRWANLYTSDLSLSNGIGDYTIVEGETELYLYNNKTNKTFKFALIEVDPSEVPKKKKG